ncbi:MAG: type III pantothenate kinase [Mycoplasma sp.]
MKKNVFIDVGNQLIKIGYINDFGEWHIDRVKTRGSTFEDLEAVFKAIDIEKVYLGSVVADITTFLSDYFKLNDIKFELISNEIFYEHIKFDQPIDINEVGTDILGFAYYIKDMKNAIAINFGTATVSIKYCQAICGVTIGIDFVNSYNAFLNMIKLNSELGSYPNFGFNTQNAINGSRYYLINGFINQMLLEHPEIDTIVYTGGNRKCFNGYNNVKNINIIEIDEAVLKGYYQVITDRNINN